MTRLRVMLGAIALVVGCGGSETITGRDQGVDPFTQDDPGFNPDNAVVEAGTPSSPRKQSPAPVDGGAKGEGGASSDAGPNGAVASCQAMSTAGQCDNCCWGLHQTGFQVWQNAFDACVCVTPGTCRSKCQNSWCAGQDPSPGGSCDTCLNGATQCVQTADATCKNDPDCAAYLACYYGSGCDTKPQ